MDGEREGSVEKRRENKEEERERKGKKWPFLPWFCLSCRELPQEQMVVLQFFSSGFGDLGLEVDVTHWESESEQRIWRFSFKDFLKSNEA